MRHAFARIAIVASLAMLGACAGMPRERSAGVADRVALRERTADLAARSHWQIDGRIAVSDGKDGGSGRLAWTQDGAAYVIVVRAPVSNDTWRLEGDAAGARLYGVRPQPIADRDAQALLARELGWHLPVTAVQHWVLGVPLDADRAAIELDDAGRPQLIRESGWTVEFRGWHDASGDTPAMPRRIVARRAPHEVRLAIAQWRFDAP